MDFLAVSLSVICSMVASAAGFSVMGLPDPLPLGGAALPLIRMARQAVETPVVQGMTTEALCDPIRSDPDHCTKIIFTAARVGPDHAVTCRFLPSLYSEGEEGLVREDLQSDAAGLVLPIFEVPEVHCPVPDLSANLNNLPRLTAVEYQVSLSNNGQDFTKEYTVTVLDTACLHKEGAFVNIADGFCLIGGKCLMAGAARPDNPAQVCSAGEDKFGWTGPELTTKGSEPTVAETQPTVAETKETTATETPEKPEVTQAVTTKEDKETVTLTTVQEATNAPTTPKTTIVVTAAETQTTAKVTTAEPADVGDSGKATAPVSKGGRNIDMVALLVSVIVLELLLIIIVVMVFMYIKSKRQKYVVN